MKPNIVRGTVLDKPQTQNSQFRKEEEWAGEWKMSG